MPAIVLLWGLGALSLAAPGCKKTEQAASAQADKPGTGAETGATAKADSPPAAAGAADPATAEASAPAQAASDGWVDFSSAEGGFQARFPAAPESQNLPTATVVGNVEQKMFSVTQGVAFYAASFADYPQTAMKEAVPATVLDGARDGAVKNVQGKLVKEDQITLDGHPGRAIHIQATAQGTSVRLDARIFLVNNRLYQMIVVRPGGGLGSDQDVAKFLDSLKLISAN
jgi:hypothetical protein